MHERCACEKLPCAGEVDEQAALSRGKGIGNTKLALLEGACPAYELLNGQLTKTEVGRREDILMGV